uniref:Protein to be involved in spindle matrix formation n=1 Tax=Lutzomyia longipalpis TaxID=7200 RepID=A0A1B0CEY4_LUTLO
MYHYIASHPTIESDVEGQMEFHSRAPPEPYYGRLIGQLTEFAHGIKGTVYAVDESTIFIKGFAYDGLGPDAYFWVGNSPRPSPEGYIIPYPEDYAGRDPPILQAHNNTDIILRLPMGKRIRDIRWLSVWCRRFTVDFGEVFIPPGLEVPKPRVLPEFKRLAHAGPDAYFWVGNGSEPNIMGIKVPNEMGSLEPLRGYQGEDIEIQLPGNLTVYDIDWLAVLTTTTVKPQHNNCREMLGGRLQVQWEIQGDNVVVDLFGRIKEDQYMAFGLSGTQGRSQMVGGDVVVAFYDTSRRIFWAEDYYLSSLSQCDGKNGVCPDRRIGGRNDVIMISGERKNGVTRVRYTRPLQTNEPINDRAIPLDREISVIGAIGPLNSGKEANAHLHNGMDATVDDIQINFSLKNDHSCVASIYDLKEESTLKPWPQMTIIGDENNVINAKIGPTGGGDEPAQPARYHPLYICDSSEGGYGQLSSAEQQRQKVYAGVETDAEGYKFPTGVGRYCEWKHKTVDKSAESESFEDYMKTLRLECEDGKPGYLNWTVEMDTPDLVYYQCYTHKNLGWKIHVVDPGKLPQTSGKHNFGTKSQVSNAIYLIVF